jgi:hypothetical protein
VGLEHEARERSGKRAAQAVRRHAGGSSLDLGNLVAGALPHEAQYQGAAIAAGMQPHEQPGDRAESGRRGDAELTDEREHGSGEQGAAGTDQALAGPSGETIEGRPREMRVDGSFIDDRDDVLHERAIGRFGPKPDTRT